ncbi:hypothetical protein [Mucilaginibacter sp.]|uniref:hypothetical protein n=1 Tax=Mucilaginibacter sp. TaxID=1882438 RepID=UPI002633FD0D|nr:hypothetical protein [Mucilaginibacter sp.]MDB4921157.1 hypothetical protein [Mucilaginibacter sp.]
MDIVIKNLEDVLNDEDGFFMKIRNLGGVDNEKLNDVLIALKEVELFYSDKDLVPKYLFFLTSAMESVLWGMIDSYKEPVREQISVSIDKISTALNRCFSTDGC